MRNSEMRCQLQSLENLKLRKYPMPDRAHAANAKARATQQVKKGNLSASEAAKITAKADKVP